MNKFHSSTMSKVPQCLSNNPKKPFSNFCKEYLYAYTHITRLHIPVHSIFT